MGRVCDSGRGDHNWQTVDVSVSELTGRPVVMENLAHQVRGCVGGAGEHLEPCLAEQSLRKGWPAPFVPQ